MSTSRKRSQVMYNPSELHRWKKVLCRILSAMAEPAVAIGGMLSVALRAPASPVAEDRGVQGVPTLLLHMV